MKHHPSTIRLEDLSVLTKPLHKRQKGAKMKRFVLFSLVIFSGVLAACSQNSEASLEGLGHSGVPIVTDVAGLTEPLSRFAEVHVAPTEKLADVAVEYGAGVVSYDIALDLAWPLIWIEPEERIPKRISKFCQLTLCDEDGNPVPDPRTGALAVGFDFTAVYATPELLGRVADFGYSANDFREMNFDKVSQIVAEAGLSVAGVGLLTPEGYDRYCKGRRPVPHFCTIASAGNGLEVDTLDVHDLNKHVDDVGLIITNYGNLRHLDLAGELVQLRGKGLQPLVSALQVGASERVGEEEALHLAESLLSDEGQQTLAEAGVVPVTQHAYESAVADDVAGHIENAFEYGQLSTPSESF